MIDLKISPYSLNKQKKHVFLTNNLSELTNYHYNNCIEYRNILDALSFNVLDITDYLTIPFLPVKLFKELSLLSTSPINIIKTMTSSGTTGQVVSKIFLDKETATAQQKILSIIITDFIGKKRMPMIILDTSAILKDRTLFSARGAGILGFSLFAYDKIYALNDKMELNIEGLKKFLSNHKDEQILLFGFTFMIWQHFYKELENSFYRPDLSKGILIHGGGWKKLISEEVPPELFKLRLNEVCGITHIHDYYGMVEQTGTVHVECMEGYLHTSIYSDIITRRPLDYKPCDIGEKGIIQTVSIIPKSYPGHSLLTEDEGIIYGEDNCKCGRLGKYFKILGRIKNAEIRGCSDTYADKFK